MVVQYVEWTNGVERTGALRTLNKVQRQKLIIRFNNDLNRAVTNIDE